MSTQPIKYTATAQFSLLQNADLDVNTWIEVEIHPDKIPIVWKDGRVPTRSRDFLDVTFVAGYQVSYDVEYYLGGKIYIDFGSAQFVSHTTDMQDNTMPPDILTPTKGYGLEYYWQYGITGGTSYSVPVGVVPSRIRYSVQRSGIKYIAREMNWMVGITITVVQDCTYDNIGAQICQDLCLSSLSSECYANYNQYCLQGKPEMIATQPCRDFFTKWIAVKGSDSNIDRQARNYCSKKYTGFVDLLDENPKIPDSERLIDVSICACNLVATPNDQDPDGTVLYSNYFKSLETQYPGFGVYGASIQQKCLVPECASAAFKPAGVGPGGCKVPQCIELVTITNDGTINGDVTVNQSQSCQQTAGGKGNLTVATVVIIVLAVLIVVFAIIYFFTTPGSHRFVARLKLEPVQRSELGSNYLPS